MLMHTQHFQDTLDSIRAIKISGMEGTQKQPIATFRTFTTIPSKKYTGLNGNYLITHTYIHMQKEQSTNISV